VVVPVRVEISREMLEWARERARLDEHALSQRFPKLAEWERGEAQPTLKQLEKYAQATHTPVGYLLLETPPVEELPIPDFRTMRDATLERPSADLLDTIYQSQQRQAWYADFAEASGVERLAFVGSLNLSSSIVDSAATIREALRFGVDERGPTWTEALSGLVLKSEELGILVMINGVVGSNTRRKLDPREFRGFALVDPLAPVIFVNGADTKAAQIFTLVHEVAHQWLGRGGLDDVDLSGSSNDEVELWCNRVAGEILVPQALLRQDFNATAGLEDELDRLARTYKVSTLVILRGLRDAEFISATDYPDVFRTELSRVLDLIAERGGSGGNFYNTLPIRVSRKFAQALVASTLEGQTLYRDAFQMLGFRKLTTFEELAVKLGVTQ